MTASIKTVKNQEQLEAFIEGWASGTIKDNDGLSRALPDEYQHAVNDAGDAFFETVALDRNPFPPTDTRYWFWRYGWIDTFRQWQGVARRK